MMCEPKLIVLETYQLYSRLISCTQDSSVVLEGLEPSIWSLSVCVCQELDCRFYFLASILGTYS